MWYKSNKRCCCRNTSEPPVESSFISLRLISALSIDSERNSFLKQFRPRTRILIIAHASHPCRRVLLLLLISVVKAELLDTRNKTNTPRADSQSLRLVKKCSCCYGNKLLIEHGVTEEPGITDRNESGINLGV